MGESKHMVDSLGSARCEVILDTKKEINPYYLNKLNCKNLPFKYFDDINAKGSFVAFLDSCQKDYLIFGALSSTNWENYPLILEKFPYLIQHKTYCGGDFYLFSGTKPAKELTEYFYSTNNSCQPVIPNGGLGFEIKGLEFSPAYSLSLRDLIHSANDVIDVSVDVKTPLVFPGAWLVVSITSDGKDIRWNSVALGDYVKPGHEGRVFQSLRLSDIELRHHWMMFNAYIWNPKKLTFSMDNFRIRVRSGNPVIYGLNRPVICTRKEVL